MRWWKPKAGRGAGRISRRHLLRTLKRGSPAERRTALELLLAKGEPLTAEEALLLCPLLEELTSRSEVAPEEIQLIQRTIEALGQARWRAALPTLVDLYRQEGTSLLLRETLRQTLEAIQPGLTLPDSTAPDAPTELQPRTVMEKGLLTRNGLPALRGFLERMPLCGAFAVVEIPLSRTEMMLRTDRSRFADRRLQREPDFSGTLEEVTQRIIDGLYANAADLGRKMRARGRAVIQPHTREGIPGIAEVRTEFGPTFAYLDLVARCDRDWFYYWGTERDLGPGG